MNMNIRNIMPKGMCATMAALIASLPLMGAQDTEAAMGVIKRFMGEKGGKVALTLEISEELGANKTYKLDYTQGKLKITANTEVALCKGFYDFVRSQGMGIDSWSGSRFTGKFPSKPVSMSKSSPFRDHYYFNVVTYGYTLPYWDWKRWAEELDWMALHGFDMPLALVAQEAIMARVWKKMGLTDKEINEYFVGPAHLPWMRMGNASGIDGPLTAKWHQNQIDLQHKVLKRMRELDMKPICPAFAGFVPPAIKRLHPQAQITQTSWAGAFHNWFLSPKDPLFVKMGTEFIKEWEAEFGKNKYYLADSFNEMKVKLSPQELEFYGKQVYESIKGGNPDAVWTMQGWMFGYQREEWNPTTLSALLKNVPNDKMLLLDLAVDYNKHFWRNGNNWDYFKSFFGKPWVYSVIPNMGGKTGHTGVLEFYANGQLEALNSPNKGKLVGFGMAPEGIENNEVIYELLSDAGWSDTRIDLNAWLANYNLCRYGAQSPELQEYWGMMLKSVYGAFTDHPRYNWQLRPGHARTGTILFRDAPRNNNYATALKAFVAAGDKYAKEPL